MTIPDDPEDPSHVLAGTFYPQIPDVRDGLTRLERIILVELQKLEKERPGRMIPSVQLWGRVVERIDCSADQIQETLARMGKASGGC